MIEIEGLRIRAERMGGTLRVDDKGCMLADLTALERERETK